MRGWLAAVGASDRPVGLEIDMHGQAEGNIVHAGEAIPEEILDHVVSGMNLSPGRLRDQLDESPTLLVFLRHFGCIFCRETVADLRRASETDPEFPRTLFFFQGTPTEGRAFMRRYWPSLRAIADPHGEMYEAFDIERGGLMQALGPAVWRGRRRAVAKGHSNGPRSGDVWRMPGLILTSANRVHWVQPMKHAAELPDLEQVGRMMVQLECESGSAGV